MKVNQRARELRNQANDLPEWMVVILGALGVLLFCFVLSVVILNFGWVLRVTLTLLLLGVFGALVYRFRHPLLSALILVLLRLVEWFQRPPVAPQEARPEPVESSGETTLAEFLRGGVPTLEAVEAFGDRCEAESLDLAELQETCQSEIEDFFRYLVSDITADGLVEPMETEVFDACVNLFKPSETLLAECRDTLQRVRGIQRIAQGEVEPLPAEDIDLILRGGEVAWYRVAAKVVQESSRESKVHHGELYVTSARVVFHCQSYPIDIPLKHISGVEANAGRVLIAGHSKRYTEDFWVQGGDRCEAHVLQALRAFHQHADLRQTLGTTRHIPGTVKQGVWQRDNGQCVQCGATDYLEFDHIIPWSKGGSNDEQNIQLLCRTCNLAKSDSI